MHLTLRRFGLVAALGLGLLGSGEASADGTLSCDLSGTWLPDNEQMNLKLLMVTTNSRSAVLSGVYTSPSEDTTATANGSVTNGTWLIDLSFMDAEDRGELRHLVGSGDPVKAGRRLMGSRNVSIKGDFTETINGNIVKKGTFAIEGTCK